MFHLSSKPHPGGTCEHLSTGIQLLSTFPDKEGKLEGPLTGICEIKRQGVKYNQLSRVEQVSKMLLSLLSVIYYLTSQTAIAREQALQTPPPHTKK
jgi:hypothetical protein